MLNRRVGRMCIFDKDDDYAAFLQVLDEAAQRTPMPLFSYCLMPNHWHLVLRPRKDGDLSRYMQWLTTTHMRRWHAYRGTRGTGPLYQGRYKSFPVQNDRHFLTVCRYVERNPLRARLVRRAENWRWSSLALRLKKKAKIDSPPLRFISPGFPPANLVVDSVPFKDPAALPRTESSPQPHPATGR